MYTGKGAGGWVCLFGWPSNASLQPSSGAVGRSTCRVSHRMRSAPAMPGHGFRQTVAHIQPAKPSLLLQKLRTTGEIRHYSQAFEMRLTSGLAKTASVI